MSAVSPKKIIDAEQNARDAYTRAFGPMPVPQPDGTHIQLCWYARIDRAFSALESVKGTDREPLIRDALQTLIQQSQRASDAAHHAADEYERLCALANQQPANIVPQNCDCAESGQWQVEKMPTLQRIKMGMLVADLLMPKNDDLPELVGLVDLPTDAIKRALLPVVDQMRTYYQTCRKSGIQPDWRVY